MVTTFQQGSGAGGNSGIRVPRTRAELDALAARRGELQGQLRSSEERRMLLAAQAQHLPSDGRVAVLERVATLDERIASMERQIQQLDDAIATGLANPALHGGADVATPTLAPPAPPGFPGPPPPGGEPVVMIPPLPGMFPIHGRTLVAGGLFTLSLLGLIVWMAVRLAIRRMTGPVNMSAADSSQLNQLQQSVDAIAVEVERISENQRYVTRLLNEGAPSASDGGADRGELQPARPLKSRDR